MELTQLEVCVHRQLSEKLPAFKNPSTTEATPLLSLTFVTATLPILKLLRSETVSGKAYIYLKLTNRLSSIYSSLPEDAERWPEPFRDGS